jgi:Zn-dependent metalloprotease
MRKPTRSVTSNRPVTIIVACGGKLFQWLGGVHTNSGIPNHAFFLVAIAIEGYAWERAGQIWYDTICDKQLSQSASFAAFAAATAAHAAERYGSQSTERKAVLDAWKQVGVSAGTAAGG